MKRKLSKGIRKYIRKEKARLRREIFDFKKREKEVKKLTAIFIQKQSSY